MRLAGVLATVLLLGAACGDNKLPVNDDAGVTPGTLAACLDRPTDLPRPTTQLPCELLPPGFVQP